MKQTATAHPKTANGDHVLVHPSDASQTTLHGSPLNDKRLVAQDQSQTETAHTVRLCHRAGVVMPQQPAALDERGRPILSYDFSGPGWQRRISQSALHAVPATYSKVPRKNPHAWLYRMPDWFARLYLAPFPTLYRVEYFCLRIYTGVGRSLRLLRVWLRRG